MTTARNAPASARTNLWVSLMLTAQIGGLAAPAAHAGDDHDTFFVRLRGIAVTPQDDSSVVTAGGAPIAGSGVGVNNDYMPEIDITYKFAPNWGIELIAATTNHQVDGKGSIAALGEAIDTWVLPPTLTLQYHFLPEGKLRPYIGAGVNYTNFYDESVKGPLAQPGARVDIENSWGYALQAGVDYEFTDRWFVNADLKYIDIDTTAQFVGTTAGNLEVDVDVDPLVFGLGIGYRF